MHCHILVEKLSSEVTHRALFEAFERCQGCVKACVWSLPSDRCVCATMSDSLPQCRACVWALLSDRCVYVSLHQTACHSAEPAV